MDDQLQERKPGFLDRLWVFIVAVAAVGPFALPLFWRNPRYSFRAKVIVSVAVIVFTVILVWISWEAFKQVWQQYQELKQALEQAG